MKAKRIFISLLIAFTLLCLTTCENNIINKWWEEDYDYVAIMKNVEHLVYETIIETEYIYKTFLEKVYIFVDEPVPPPEILMQYINIVDIQFIIFAGESIVFNGEHGQGGSTDLTDQEKATNSSIIDYLAGQMSLVNASGDTKKDYFLILHGYANPVKGTQEEAAQLEYISKSRAEASKGELYTKYGTTAETDLEKRITTKGYGGGRTLSGPTSTYAGLNRRVEAILFEIVTEKVEPDKQR